MVDLKIKLPDDYLNEEVRDGFTVTTERKQIWAVQIDLMMELFRVCDKYNINIMADAGTILGAVRHKGYIPWDDDIDLCVMRPDYEKLCEVAPREFSYPYFFQTEETDPGSCRGHAQLRNSDTAAILKTEKAVGYSFNQGIFIDIFPFDIVPADVNETLDLIHRVEKNRVKAISYAKVFYSKNPGIGYRKIVAKTLQGLVKLFRVKYNNVYYKQMEKDKISYRDIESPNIANLFRILRNDPGRLIYKKEWYRDTKEVPFEFITIKIPAGYEEYLLKAYGNWKEFVRGDTIHGDIIFDTGRSYKEYL